MSEMSYVPRACEYDLTLAGLNKTDMSIRQCVHQ